MSLEQRRFIADATFLFKVLNGDFNVDFSSFLNFYCPDDHYTHSHHYTRDLHTFRCGVVVFLGWPGDLKSVDGTAGSS